MDWYEAEVKALERAPRTTDCPVVFYGSSSIRMWPCLQNGEAVNRGFGGSTLEACAYFFERLVVPLHPRSLVVYAGDNDLGDGRSPEEVLRFFRQLADKVGRQLPGIPFGYMSIKPSPARASILERIRRANDLIRQEIENRPAAYFIPVFEAMLSPAGKPRNDLFLEDGLHLGSAGYQLWEELLRPFRNRIFTQASGCCNTKPLSFEQGAPGVQELVQPPPES